MARLKTTVFLAVLFVLLGINVSVTAQQEDEPKLILMPAKQELVMSGGERGARKVRVINGLKKAANFSISFEDFTSGRTPEEIISLLGDGRGRYSLKDYLSVKEGDKKFSLAPGESRDIQVTIDLPSGLPPSGLYGSLLVAVSGGDGREDVTGQAEIITRLGSLFFVRVDGPVKEAGQLIDFGLTGHRVFGRAPLTFSFLFKNTGDVHLNPYGFIVVKNWLGKEVLFRPIDPWFVLPRSTRLRQAAVDSTLSAGVYWATLRLNRGYENIVDTKESVFFEITSSTVTVLVTLFLAAVLVLQLLRWRRKKR